MVTTSRFNGASCQSSWRLWAWCHGDIRSTRDGSPWENNINILIISWGEDVYTNLAFIIIYIYVMCYMKSLLLDIHVQVCSVYNMYWNIDIHTLCDDYISNHHSTLQDMWSSPLHFLEDWRCLSIFEVRFVVKPGTTLELLAGARPPKQFAARTAGVLSWC